MSTSKCKSDCSEPTAKQKACLWCFLCYIREFRQISNVFASTLKPRVTQGLSVIVVSALVLGFLQILSHHCSTKKSFQHAEPSLHGVRANKTWGLATQRREGADLLMKKRLNCPLLPEITPTSGTLPVTPVL